MKKSLLIVLTSATLLLVMAAIGSGDIVLNRGELHDQAVEESLLPACLGVPGEIPFWNAYSSRFMFAPAFDFKEVENAVDYRFVLTLEEGGEPLSFCAAHPWSALSPVWEETPVGYVDLEVEALDSSGQEIGIAGSRRFYRAAVFNGPYYREPIMSYTNSARKAFEYLYFSTSWLQHWLTDGTPDPLYSHYCYPSKMIVNVINGMLRYGEMAPENKTNAWEIARIAADHLISVSEPDGAPLAYFPPTYDGDFFDDDIDYGYNVDHAKATSRANAGTIMLIYPVRAALAYLNLYQHTQDTKYYEAAHKIADTYFSLQDDEGHWPLVMDAQTGLPTVSNYASSVEIRALLECFVKDYGIDEYEPAIQIAEALWISEIENFGFEAQFEDATPGEENKNLAGIPAQDAARYFFGKARDAEDEASRNSLIEKAKNYLRFAEDQFVVWSDPIPKPRPTTARYSYDWVFFPCALEQYYCYRPIDVHAALFVSAFADAWKTTGEKIYLAKAISLANALTRAQAKDGRYPTWWKSSEYTNPGWMNCAVRSALAMQEFGETLPEWELEFLAYELEDTVHWNGTGDWTSQNDWVDSAAAPDWAIPGWVAGNPLNTNIVVDLDWNGGAANIDSGTVNITPGAKPAGTIDVLHVSCDASSATLNISTDFTVRRDTYTGYLSTADDISTINQTAGSVLLVNTTIFAYDPPGTTLYNLSGGTLETRGADVLFGRLGTFEFNQTGGTYTHIGANEVYISVYGGADATINLEDGTFRANVDGVGLGRTSAAVFNQTGGTFEAAKLEMALLAASEGTYSISGGSFTVSGSVYGNAGTAVFEVLGSDATIIEAGSFDLSEDTFRVKLDDNGSTLARVVSGGINLINATLEMDVLAGFSGTLGDTYDIMWTANGFQTDGMVISNLGSTEFDWDVVTKDGGEVLQATVISESAR